MEPRQFIDKWRSSERPERAAAQQHFLDLCDLLEVPKSGDRGQSPHDYEFKKRAAKSDGRDGRADVLRRRHFAWEYKGPSLSLAKAYSQLKGYADALENSPLLIVSDTREIRIDTNFTNAVKEEWVIPIADLNDPGVRTRLRRAWTDADAAYGWPADLGDDEILPPPRPQPGARENAGCLLNMALQVQYS